MLALRPLPFLVFMYFFFIAGDLSFGQGGAELRSAQEQMLVANPGDREIVEALSQRGDWQFKEEPLEEAVEELRDRLGIRVALDEDALQRIGRSASTPISLEIRNVQARSMLHHLLKPLQLTWAIRNRGLVITTPEEAEADTAICVHLVDQIRLERERSAEPLTFIILEMFEPESWEERGGCCDLAKRAEKLIGLE